MTTRLECFLSNRWPANSPLRADAIALGFAESGFVAPREYFRDGRVDMDNLFAVFDELDAKIANWVPLCLNFEHNTWFTLDDGPISGAAYLRLQQFVSRAMHERYQRLIINWGSPKSNHPLQFKASEVWSCAGMGAYWKEGQTTGAWFYNVRRHAANASPFALPTMLYVSPTVFPRSWRDPGVTMNNGQWNHVLNYCDEVRAKDPTTMFSFWQNRDSDEAGFTDEYLLRRMTEMAERLDDS